MSCVEIYAFDKDGEAYLYGEVKNAHGGCMAIWQELERKYLPSLPNWAGLRIPENGYISRIFFALKEDVLQPLWDLAKDDRLTEDERIVMKTTFDKAIIWKKDLLRVIEAYNNFPFDTNLKEQAEILSNALKDENVIAISWNQTSINSSPWSWFNDEDEEIFYNILTDKDHYEVFEK